MSVLTRAVLLLESRHERRGGEEQANVYNPTLLAVDLLLPSKPLNALPPLLGVRPIGRFSLHLRQSVTDLNL